MDEKDNAMKILLQIINVKVNTKNRIEKYIPSNYRKEFMRISQKSWEELQQKEAKRENKIKEQREKDPMKQSCIDGLLFFFYIIFGASRR